MAGGWGGWVSISSGWESLARATTPITVSIFGDVSPHYVTFCYAAPTNY